MAKKEEGNKKCKDNCRPNTSAAKEHEEGGGGEGGEKRRSSNRKRTYCTQYNHCRQWNTSPCDN